MKAALQSLTRRGKAYRDGMNAAIKTPTTQAYGPGRAAKVLRDLVPKMSAQERATLRAMLDSVARGEVSAGRVDGHLYVLAARPGFVTISKSRPPELTYEGAIE